MKIVNHLLERSSKFQSSFIERLTLTYEANSLNIFSFFSFEKELISLFETKGFKIATKEKLQSFREEKGQGWLIPSSISSSIYFENDIKLLSSYEHSNTILFSYTASNFNNNKVNRAVDIEIDAVKDYFNIMLDSEIKKSDGAKLTVSDFSYSFSLLEVSENTDFLLLSSYLFFLFKNNILSKEEIIAWGLNGDSVFRIILGIYYCAFIDNYSLPMNILMYLQAKNVSANIMWCMFWNMAK